MQKKEAVPGPKNSSKIMSPTFAGFKWFAFLDEGGPFA